MSRPEILALPIRLQFATRKSDVVTLRPFIEQAGNANKYMMERFFISQKNIVLTEENPDYLIILNHLNYDISHPREQTIGVVTEPSWSPNFLPGYLNRKCAVVISHVVEPFGNGVFGHSLCPPWVTREAVSVIPEKRKKLSIIVSPHKPNEQSSNYSFRHDLIQAILDSDLDCDIYGKWAGTDSRLKGFVEDKVDALLPYEFSVAIENTCEPGYSTEKLIDCFLTETQPVYLGDPLAQLHYGDNCLIPLNTKNPLELLQKIVNEDIEYNHEAVVVAKEKYLSSFNLLSRVLEVISELESKRK